MKDKTRQFLKRIKELQQLMSRCSRDSREYRMAVSQLPELILYVSTH